MSNKSWRDISIPEIVDIELIVAMFHVMSLPLFPYPKVLVYIYEQRDGSYRGTVDMAVRRNRTGDPEWIEARGKSIEGVLEQTLQALVASIERNGAVEEQDFVWKLLGER